MDMTGERRISAPREKVWAALNDPDVLKACIPGCDTLERTEENAFRATASVKIGPIAAKFAGKVQLTDIHAPESYTISGEGQGGVAGFAKGGANVKLDDDGGATVLHYDVRAQVGGKIAQLGARLIDASAKQMADQFFDRFSARVSAPAPAAAPIAAPDAVPTGTGTIMQTPAAQTPPASPPPASISLFSLIPQRPFGFPLVFWGGAVIYLAIFILIFGSYL